MLLKFLNHMRHKKKCNSRNCKNVTRVIVSKFGNISDIFLFQEVINLFFFQSSCSSQASFQEDKYQPDGQNLARQSSFH